MGGFSGFLDIRKKEEVKMILDKLVDGKELLVDNKSTNLDFKLVKEKTVKKLDKFYFISVMNLSEF